MQYRYRHRQAWAERNAIDQAHFRCKQRVNAEINRLHQEWQNLNQINLKSK